MRKPCGEMAKTSPRFPNLPEGGDGSMATTITATRQVIEDYQRLFVNRRAYTIQSLRPHPETGRHYYFRPSKKGTDIPLMLTEETVRQHLEGKITVGLYAINPSTQRCRWVAIDADYKNSMEDLLKLQYHLTQDRVEPALEMSKRGGHLWIFLATPSLARKGQSRISRRGRRGSLQRYEKLGTDHQNSAFWNTWVPCGRSGGTTSHAVHLVQTVDTTRAVTTW